MKGAPIASRIYPITETTKFLQIKILNNDPNHCNVIPNSRDFLIPYFSINHMEKKLIGVKRKTKERYYILNYS